MPNWGIFNSEAFGIITKLKKFLSKKGFKISMGEKDIRIIELREVH